MRILSDDPVTLMIEARSRVTLDILSIKVTINLWSSPTSDTLDKSSVTEYVAVAGSIKIPSIS